MKENEIELKKLQLVELDILKEFIRVCNELNVKYFLDSGTLLGCIRHGGFIPWDDDIDVSMPREDYEIFLKEGQKLLKDKYFLQTYKTDPEYTMGFAKIRNSETTFIESSVKRLNINHGVYIDIFPMDGYKPSEKIKNFINSKLNVLYNLQINKKYDNLNKANSAKLKALQGVSDLIYGKTSINKILQKKDKIAKKNEYSKSEYVAFFSYPSIPASKNYMPKDFFGEGTFKKFEDIEKVRVPANFEGYLTKVYGDYMKLPPEEKRVAHHYNEIIDLNKSYKEYERK